jgi:Uma2 family endonuclease
MIVIEKKHKPKNLKIPANLIYEELGGRLLPYKGFLDVINGNKKIEEIMGSSSLQAYLVSLINAFIFVKLNHKKYIVVTSEAGLHIEKGNNLANDIAIFDKENTILNDKYFDKPPKIAIEIDVKIDLSETEWTNEWDYVFEKSKKMLDFGTEKVIWISTKSKKIFVSSNTERWYIVNFDEDVPLFDNCILNIGGLLTEFEMEI